MKTAAALLCIVAAAPAYDGKYDDDPRLAKIREELPARYEAARKRVAAALSSEIPNFPLLLEDAGKNRSGVMAETRKGPVIVLKTEYLVLDAHDVEKTLAHELIHCMQRKLGGHAKLPAWAREGMAVHVAGQLEERIEALAVLGIDRGLDGLVDGLEGTHDLYDYAEDGCAFEALAAHVGDAKMPALLLRLCKEGISALPLSVAELDRRAGARARVRLRPMLARAARHLETMKKAEKHARAGEKLSAVLALCGAGSSPPRRPLLGRHVVLDLHVADDEFARLAARAKKDLEPFVEYDEAMEVIARRAGRAAPSPSREAR